MSELIQEELFEEVLKDELTLLKERAAIMGIQYHPSIGVDKLREKVTAALKDPSEPEEQAVEQAETSAPETKAQAHMRFRKEASVLIRVRLTCMNPAKQKWEGEIFTVSNSVIGTMKKFIPFHAEEGWHIPQALLNIIQERHYQAPYTERGTKGQEIRKYKMAKEFSIEILPPLTVEEMKDLATQQAIANRIG
jgi:hypothetical protein